MKIEPGGIDYFSPCWGDSDAHPVTPGNIAMRREYEQRHGITDPERLIDNWLGKETIDAIFEKYRKKQEQENV